MSLIVRPLQESDLVAAGEIFREAFRTHLKIPDRLLGDADFVASRYRTDPSGAFAAEEDGQLVGTHFAVNWGSLTVFGPTTVRSTAWNKKVGQKLVEASLETVRGWGSQAQVCFTFADSPRHLGFWQKFGLWPRFLTAVLATAVRPGRALPAGVTRLSQSGEQPALVEALRALTSQLHPGLDLSREIRATVEHRLGDTLLQWEGDRLVGLAVCHSGKGTQAGSHSTSVRFGAVLPGFAEGPGDRLDLLLEGAEALASQLGTASLLCGVNLARAPVYRRLLARRYRSVIQGVAMHAPDQPLTCHPGAFILDDWR